MIQTIKNLIKYGAFHMPDWPSSEAYDLWADDYDDQPDNLMFYLDQSVFMELMSPISITGKMAADMGCGTGRHWPMLFQNKVGRLTGYDVSDGMLNRLKLKFPDANAIKTTGNRLSHVADNTYDLIISTLTIAHIENIAEALSEWCRVLKPGGDMIITDFHPHMLSAGERHVFHHQHTDIPILNFVYPVAVIKQFFEDLGLNIKCEVERVLDHTLMHYYIKKNAMNVYQKMRGTPMIYGLHLKKM